jgi:hypothetical protein
MALDTYSNLKASVIAFSGRDDLSSQMDDFISLAEEAIYFNDVFPLRLQSMETILTDTTAGPLYTLPADYMEIRSLTITNGGNECELSYASPAVLQIISGTGAPYEFTIVGSDIKFNITPDSAYAIKLTYYAKPTALSSLAPTNAVLTNHPSIYLNGCLSMVAQYAGEESDAENAYQKMIRSIRGARRGDSTGRYPKGSRAKVRGSTP